MNQISNHLEIQKNQQKNQNKHNLLIIYSSLNNEKKKKLTFYHWSETGVSVPEEIYVPTNIIVKNDFKAKSLIFRYFYICLIRHNNDKTFSLLFPGVQVSNLY